MVSWLVDSSTSKEIQYEVEQLTEKIETCSPDCLAICDECQPIICIHTFSCNCVDHVIKQNICKHIHACVRHISESNQSPDNGATEETTGEECLETEEDILTPFNDFFGLPK